MLFLYLLVSYAFAATTGSLTLTGTVPTVVSITVAPISPSSALPLSTTQVDTQVANITESSNDALGYKVTISSANAGLLKNGTLSNMPYTAKYNSVSFTLSTTPVQVTSQGAQVTAVNIVKPLAISYTGIADTAHMSGAYSDTLTFSIVAN